MKALRVPALAAEAESVAVAVLAVPVPVPVLWRHHTAHRERVPVAVLRRQRQLRDPCGSAETGQNEGQTPRQPTVSAPDASP